MGATESSYISAWYVTLLNITGGIDGSWVTVSATVNEPAYAHPQTPENTGETVFHSLC